MAITEIALLHLTAGHSINDTDIRDTLSHAKLGVQKYNGYTFYVLQQIEDPSYFYIIGEWDSLEQHRGHWIPGDENQATLKELEGKVAGDWLQHIDVSHTELPVPRSAEERAKALSGELVWSVVRYFVKKGEKETFQRTFDAKKHLLQEFITEGTMGGGWRIVKEGDAEERVSLCPWKSVQQHRDFAATGAFKEYSVIKEHVEGVDIKHARLLDL